MLNFAIELIKPFVLKYKWLFTIALLLIITVPIVIKCTKDNYKKEVSPTVIIVKSTKYDSPAQKRIDKIDSVTNASIQRTKQLEGERLQRYIDSIFMQN